MNAKILITFGIILLLLGSGILIGEYIKKDKFSEVTCKNDFDVDTMWNHIRAEKMNITAEEMLNITYAYLHKNYTLYCPNNIEDCFVEFPTKECCVDDGKRWYCYEDELEAEQ